MGRGSWVRIRPSLTRGGTNLVGGTNLTNMADGVLAGCEFVDIKVEVYDGKEHPVDSKDVAFQKAGRGAFKLAVNNARPVCSSPSSTSRSLFRANTPVTSRGT